MKKEIKIFLICLILLVSASFVSFYLLNNNKKALPPISKDQNTVYKPITNSEGQVAVTVTPKNISPDASVWEFEVVLDTHSVELDYNLTKNSALIDSTGGKYPPLEWVGDPPGGHHRKGVLKFQPVAGLQGPIKLKISGVGGVAKRDFIWKVE